MDNLIMNKNTIDSREVAEMVGKRHSDLIRDIENYIQYFENAKLRFDIFFIESSYTAGTGKNYKCYDVTKKGCEFIAHKLTGQKGAIFTAKYINRFHELDNQEKLTPQYTIKDQTDALLLIADNLKVNNASKILMVNKFYKSQGIDPSFLPTYSEEKVTKSLTQLLKQFEVGISTVKFNLLLENEGILETKIRPSSKTKGKDKKYKALTEEGLKYGKNLISPHNQKETQPHYFEDTFKELVELVTN